MFAYYVQLAIRRFRGEKVYSLLIVLVIGLGLGASMTMITVLHVMTGDPVPARSGRLFYPRLDPSPPGFSSAQADPTRDFTWLDANNLLKSRRAVRQAMMAGGQVAVTAASVQKQFYSGGHYVSSDFFAMFGAPFASGTSWSAQGDEDQARVIVLNGELANRLFGGASAAVGRDLRVQGQTFRVIGVLRDWHPEPLFYSGRSGEGAFAERDTFFLPLTTAMSLKLPIMGGESCWGDGGRTSDECTWVQYWVELDNSAQVADYRLYLLDYWHDQKTHGRFPQNQPPKLYSLMQRLQALQLVPANVKLQLWLAFGFLAVCLFNTVCLMLARFLRRGGEISVRRALGATRQDTFQQLAVEAGMLGLAGGLIGLLLTWFGLWLVRQRPDAYAKLAHLDLAMVMGTFVLAILVSVLAGVLPAWRASRVSPALQLKIQ